MGVMDKVENNCGYGRNKVNEINGCEVANGQYMVCLTFVVGQFSAIMAELSYSDF